MTSAALNSPTISADVNEEAEVLTCFVCGIEVTGLYFTLTSIKTHSSKTRIVEKLSDVLGDKFLVIISEDDVICRSCTKLIDTLDRLQTEVNSITNVVLTFLEKKYFLEHGDHSKQEANINSDQNAFLECKKRQVEEHGFEIEKLELGNDSKSKTNMWLQCDKCQYTTQYNAYMVHHVRQHMKESSSACDVCNNSTTDDQEHKGMEKVNKSPNKRPNIESAPIKSFTKTQKSSIGENVTSMESADLGNMNEPFSELTQNITPQKILSETQDMSPSSTSTSDNIYFNLNKGSDQVLVQNSEGVYMQVDLVKGDQQFLTVNEDGSVEVVTQELWPENC